MGTSPCSAAARPRECKPPRRSGALGECMANTPPAGGLDRAPVRPGSPSRAVLGAPCPRPYGPAQPRARGRRHRRSWPPHRPTGGLASRSGRGQGPRPALEALLRAPTQPRVAHDHLARRCRKEQRAQDCSSAVGLAVDPLPLVRPKGARKPQRMLGGHWRTARHRCQDPRRVRGAHARRASAPGAHPPEGPSGEATCPINARRYRTMVAGEGGQPGMCTATGRTAWTPSPTA